MPGKVKVRILAGRNLPVMDRASDTSDAFVEVKLGNTTFKTEVCRRSLNPQWNSEWFKFEVDDEELQDDSLQIRIMDYDAYSANDAIGKVYIDLNPLLNKETGPVMSGWFPIYDTMHGLRGEINVMVKVDLFSDSNKYRESSCGVLFFYSHGVPHCHKAQAILGFVEELVVNDDPEYQWIDKIRTPRASNEARQTLFSKLSGEVQRKIGLKALELGGNAVIGYHQCFDLEGESGIVVRGIGTAVTLVRLVNESNLASPPKDTSTLRDRSPCMEDNLPLGTQQGHISPINPLPISKMQHSPSKTGIGGLAVRRLSDPDLSTTPKGTNTISGGSGGKPAAHRPLLNKDGLDMLEYPFVTMKSFPPHVIQHIGGVVSARSVKLLDQINNPDDPETRDAWWTEIRKEIRSHTRALGCNVVLGYSESTNISDDVCILSASGTAAILLPASEFDTSFNSTTNSAPMLGLALTSRPTIAMDRRVSSGLMECEKEKDIAKDKERPLRVDVNLANQTRHPHGSDWSDHDLSSNNLCGLCHIPYSEASVPFSSNLVQCAICRRSKVPDVLFMTIEPPPGTPITGKGCFIQARVIRMKKDSKGEQNAKDISDSLPFLEYELHKQLLAKLKVKGMNGLFGLNLKVAVGEKMIIGIASGTGAYLTALPVPTIPKITCVKGADASKISEMQKLVLDTVIRNKECYELRPPVIETVEEHVNGRTEEGESVIGEIDFSSGNKDAFVLEVDDADVDILSLLADPKPPPGFELCNTEKLPGMDNFVSNIQMFTRVYRTKLLSSNQTGNKFAQHFEFLLQSLFVKLRKLTPCCIAGLQFQIDLIEQDELQVYINGVAVGLGDPGLLSIASQKCKAKPSSLQTVTTESEPDLVFNIDMEKSGEATRSLIEKPTQLKPQISLSQSAEGRFNFNSVRKEHFGIELTPLSYVPGGKIERYLGNLNFFFIRESASIRECGGLSGFIQSFVTEVLAIVRAHVAALSGNAMIAFNMQKCILMFNPHKNQGQCLINVCGDAVSVHYSSQNLPGHSTSSNAAD